MTWKTLDVAELLNRRAQQHEATTTANVGPYAVPLGGLMRPARIAPVGMVMAEPAQQHFRDIDEVLADYEELLSRGR